MMPGVAEVRAARRQAREALRRSLPLAGVASIVSGRPGCARSPAWLCAIYSGAIILMVAVRKAVQAGPLAGRAGRIPHKLHAEPSELA